MLRNGNEEKRLQQKHCSSSPEAFCNIMYRKYNQNMHVYMPLRSRKLPLWSREHWLDKGRKVLVSVWESGSAFWIHDKENLPCDFRKPCWGSSEHPCTQSLVEDWKYLVSARSEGEISLCLLILWKLVNLKHGMGFFLLSNSGKGRWRLLFPPTCHILYLPVSSYRMH